MRGKTPLTQNFVKTSAELRQNFGRPSTDLHQTEIVQVILDQLRERDHHLLPHHHTRVSAVLGHKESNDGLGCLPPELGLTARCYTTMVTALLAGSPLPLIRTCPPGWGPTPAVFAVIETPWTTGRSRAFPLSWSRCDLPASVFVEYVEGSTAEKSQNLSEKYERRVVTPSLSLPSRGRQYAEHDQPSLLELIRAATAEQTFCSIMMVQKFSLRIRELQARL